VNLLSEIALTEPANQTIKNGLSSGSFYKIWALLNETKYPLKSLCKRLKGVILAHNFYMNIKKFPRYIRKPN